MVIKNFTRKELQDILFDYNERKFKIPEVNNGCNVYHFKDFRYFDADNLIGNHGEKDNNFLVAYDENNPLLIYGVIDYGWYGYEVRYIAVSYIDINDNYKRTGVATRLINELNNQFKLMGITKFELSSLSEEGKQANIDKTFKRLMTNAEMTCT